MTPTRFSLAVALLLALLLSPKVVGQSLCPGDATNDGQVNGVDIAQVLADWGSCPSCPGDVDDDGQVNGVDLAQVLAGWGPCRPVILSITPDVGYLGGGSLVTITGAYLGTTSSVEFGGVPGTGFEVINSSTLRVVTPANPIGTTAVRVTTNAGSVVRKGGFDYIDVVVPAWATLIEATPDPAVVTNEALRNAIVETSYAWRVRDNATQIELLLIPPGTFSMGCSGSSTFGCSSNENPVHVVTLTQPFYLGRYEVTQGEWQAVIGSNPSFHQGPSFPDASARPVETVSWNMTQGFNTATGLRLPTEAEWEYAYRAGTTTAFHSFSGYPSGTSIDALLGEIAWYSVNSFSPGLGNHSRPVGTRQPNGFGLHDMAGNVFEWVHDWYSSSYYQSSPSTNPSGPSTGTTRVYRGGSWGSGSQFCRASRRQGSLPDSAGPYGPGLFGFRVARNP